MAIRFRPGRLGRKPDTLTRRWDVYQKEGDTATFADANADNFRLIFTTDQLQASLSVTYLEEPLLRASVIMDLHQLHTDIKTAQSTDPTCIDGLTKANDGISNWTIDDDGLLQQNNRLWNPDALDLTTTSP